MSGYFFKFSLIILVYLFNGALEYCGMNITKPLNFFHRHALCDYSRFHLRYLRCGYSFNQLRKPRLYFLCAFSLMELKYQLLQHFFSVFSVIDYFTHLKPSQMIFITIYNALNTLYVILREGRPKDLDSSLTLRMTAM
ncbi:hypothetical protein SDC9_178233 [bioreactor metagenome]|uniref:Uncharacterized protein n=1 Tax=bioreactor metagenome TaxID=1076179 RepID=A0A645GXK3_9ZZZZ